MNRAWYLRRLARMDPSEVAGRVRDQVLQRSWRRRQVRPGADDPRALPPLPVEFTATLVPGAEQRIPADARARLLVAADQLLDGRWPVFALQHTDLVPVPDWFVDPRTGRRAPADAFCFSLNHRDESRVGNVKYVWELSRHHHLTVLAAAWRCSGDDRYAAMAVEHLSDWCERNPFLSGIHWTSGIEIGIRLISWVWTRRLLDGWHGAPVAFERSPVFLRQLHHHHEWLATFPSRGTSANNHRIAELAGQYVASCAFPWFDETSQWRAAAAAGLEREVPRQMFGSGVNRELATPYHGLVLELQLAAAIEGDRTGHPLSAALWTRLCAAFDALAAIVDVRRQPPRQGDDDGGHGLVLDAPGYDRWSSLLATGAELFDALPWWPEPIISDVRSPLLTASCGDAHRRAPSSRPGARHAQFTDAGITIIRDRAEAADELWCRFDHGPHGYPGIAAHAHADALSIELRVGGVEVLADPGTYCYHGEPSWRMHFRSTRAHNTVEVDGADSSVQGGPFLWSTQARTVLEETTGVDGGPVARVTASHDGYRRLTPPAVHRRTVEVSRDAREVTVIDQVESDGAHRLRMTWQLGPQVSCELSSGVAYLTWRTADGSDLAATIELSDGLDWRVVRGMEAPIEGWYSPAFDVRIPSTALIGVAGGHGPRRAQTRLALRDGRADRHPAEVVAPVSTTADDGDRDPS